MAYTRTNWVEEETPLSAQNMNNIEDGIEELQSQKVDKVSGKDLSDNNYTNADKTKLAGVQAGAQVNPGVATPSANGLMSAADKNKINSIHIFSLTATGATTTIPAGGTTTINFSCATTACELAAIQSISLADGVAICGIGKRTSSGGGLVGWAVKVVNTKNRTVQVASPTITAVIIKEEIS